MNYYALIDDDGVVIGFNRSNIEINDEKLINVDSTFNMHNKKYNFETKQFEDFVIELITNNGEKHETQLDRIEKLSKSINDNILKDIEEIKQETEDSYTLYLMENNII